MLEALEGLDLDPIDPPRGGPLMEGVDENQQGAFTPKLFGPYFAGNKFGAVAIGLRAEGDEARSLAREHRLMSQGMLDAWAAVNTT